MYKIVFIEFRGRSNGGENYHTTAINLDSIDFFEDIYPNTKLTLKSGRIVYIEAEYSQVKNTIRETLQTIEVVHGQS